MAEPEQRMEEYFAQIESHERNPIVANVLAQDTSFEGEVEGFYNIATWLGFVPRAGVVREFKSGEEDSQKKGKYPAELVKILDCFGGEALDTQKLQYDSVREDYGRWNKTSRRLIRTVVSMGGIIGGAAGLAVCLATALNGNPEIAIPSGIVGAGAMGAGFWAAMYYPEPNGTNNELMEYVKLHEIAKKADGFMEGHYRKHFIKRALSEA